MSICTTNYYESLSAAVADLNAGVTTNALADSVAAKVKVNTICAGTTVRLLDNVAETQKITVEKDMTLELDDKTLSFSDEGYLDLAAGTDVTISGGTVERTVTAEDTAMYMIQTAGSLKLRNGTYTISGCHASTLLAIKATNQCSLLDIQDCQVSAINPEAQTSASVWAIQTQAAQTLVNGSTVTTQGGSSSFAVLGMGDIMVENSNITASSRENSATAVYLMDGVVIVDSSALNAAAEKNSVHTVFIIAGEATVNDSTVTASSDSSYAYAVHLKSGAITVEGSSVSATSTSSNAYSIYADEGTVDVSDSTFNAITYGDRNVSANGIEVGAGTTVTAKDSSIQVDAKHYTTETEVRSVAISNNGTVSLENVAVTATFTGVFNYGKLYVSGGSYNGFTYGGFITAHGTEGCAFINDATIRGGDYQGVFDYSDSSYTKYTAMYVGCSASSEHNSNMVVYLDGCTIDGSGANTSLVLRGTGGEKNNTLNISNTTFVASDKWIRIDNETHKMNVGVGMAVGTLYLKNAYFDDTEVNYEEAGVVEYTGALYRRHYDGQVCRGKDVEAVVELVEAQGPNMVAELVTTEEMDTITQSFQRPDNGQVQIYVYVPPISGPVTEKATLQIGSEKVFEGFLMSNSNHYGTAFVEYHVRKDAPCNAAHYYTHGAGLADLHAMGVISGTAASTVTLTAPTGAAFPIGTRLYICAEMIG